MICTALPEMWPHICPPNPLPCLPHNVGFGDECLAYPRQMRSRIRGTWRHPDLGVGPFQRHWRRMAFPCPRHTHPNLRGERDSFRPCNESPQIAEWGTAQGFAHCCLQVHPAVLAPVWMKAERVSVWRARLPSAKAVSGKSNHHHYPPRLAPIGMVVVVWVDWCVQWWLG